jgi:glycosyltransferase involved in cell wall biosynthesis
MRSLSAVCSRHGAELCILSANHLDDRNAGCEAEWIRLSSIAYLPGERQLRKSLGLADKSQSIRGEPRLRRLLRMTDTSDALSVAGKNNIDVLLPLLDVPPWKTSPKLIGWVPDFQHVYLPEFFSQAEIEWRNSTIGRVIERAALIMLSSQAAREDFTAFSPESAHKARIVSFPSVWAFETLTSNPEVSVARFHLPEKFALVTNQFWAHKNHRVVVDALARLKTGGLQVPVVMTGLPVDQRDPANANLSSLLQAIASAGLNEQITILGQVPFSDLINLVRTATVIIQPSRFEGWSTVVQDAKAIGRPLLCSDIPVHREQAPMALGFFPCDSPEVLADLLASHWESLRPGPNLSGEAESLLREREFADRHGEILMAVCEEAAQRN